MKTIAIGTFILSCGMTLGGCGNEAEFGGDTLRKITDPHAKEETQPTDHSTEQSEDVEVAEDTNTGDPSTDTSADDVIDSDGDDQVANGLFLSWACPTDAAGPTSPDPAAMTVKMPGSRVVKLGAAVAEPLGILNAGHYCNPSRAPRDIVFVVDVSDSMRDFFNNGNDRLVNGVCARMTAINAVLDTLDERSRVAVITFDDHLRQDSGGFVTPADLKTKYVKSTILCEVGSGTSYKPGLARTEVFMQDRRPEAAAEVYFISDGYPNSTASNGATEAARIRQYATVATMMLKGDDTVLIQKIASKDAQGNPIHGKVDSADKMAEKLKDLATARLVSVTLQITAAAKPETLLFEQIWDAAGQNTGDTYATTGAPLEVVPADYPDGLSLGMTYLDSRGVKFKNLGVLTFEH
jgi:hypothetical protein